MTDEPPSAGVAQGSAVTPAVVLRTALLVGAVVVLALLVWQLSVVLMVAFAAVLFAIILRSLAALVESHTPLRPPWSLVTSGLLISIVVAGFVFLLGSQIHSEVSSLIERFPQMLSDVGKRLGIEDLRQRLVDQVEDLATRSGMVGKVADYTSTLVAVLANAVLVAVAGVYLAAHPARYRDGLLQLVPGRIRSEAANLFDNVGRALQLWLLGQLFSMTVVGVLVTAGLYAIGMPSALALGFLAGVSEFIPVVGPVLSAFPAILLALSEGGTTALWVIGLYVLVQQIESNVLTPLVQRRTVDLPPVMTLFAILSFGILFGPLGIVLGTPLAVVLFVAVRQLYVRDALGEETEIPGEDKE